MSIQLLSQTDYISVVWEIREREIKCETSKVKQEFIRLFFTIQINWKLKTTNHSFLLEESKMSEPGWTLKNWNEWYSVYNTLRDLWYSVWDNSDPIVSGAGIMNEWVAILKEY